MAMHAARPPACRAASADLPATCFVRAQSTRAQKYDSQLNVCAPCRSSVLCCKIMDYNLSRLRSTSELARPSTTMTMLSTRSEILPRATLGAPVGADREARATHVEGF